MVSRYRSARAAVQSSNEVDAPQVSLFEAVRRSSRRFAWRFPRSATTPPPSFVVDPNPFFGRVSYTHGLGIDQPLNLIRIGYGDRLNTNNFDVGYRSLEPFIISPLWNERGQPYLGVFDDGGIQKCDSAGTWCVYLSWRETEIGYTDLILDRALGTGV